MRSCPHCFSPYAAEVEFCGIDGTRLVVTEVDPLIGKDIDRYRVQEKIGDGAMARVYRATHTVLELQYAVKVLLGEIASDKKLGERFRREAQVISKLRHPNIVQIMDFGTTSLGLTFLIMELLRGRTLRTVIKKEAPFAPERAANITRQIAAGLAEAHGRGFVHRDLKPGNVMVMDEGGTERVKLLDFGLVHAPETDVKEAFLTKTGQFLGTPIYMAPEQIIGADVTHHADLYSLGVVLFEMLEGKPPFRAKNLAEIRKKHLSEPPPAMRPARGLEELAFALLKKEARDRPKSATAVLARLDTLFDRGLVAPEITVRTEMPFLEEKTTRVPALEPSSSVTDVAQAPIAEVIEDHIRDIVVETQDPPMRTSDVIEHERSMPPRLVSSLVAIDPAQDDAGSIFADAAGRRWLLPAGIAAVLLGLASFVLLAVNGNRPQEAQSAVILQPLQREESADPRFAAQPGAVEAVVPPKQELKKDEPAQKDEQAPAHARVIAPKKKAPSPAEPTVTRGVVQKKLDQLSARLSLASSRLKVEELRPLEDRYLELAQALVPNANEHELEELMKKANTLAKDLGRATDR